MLSTTNNSVAFLSHELDLNLGGFRIRLQSSIADSPLTSHTHDEAYLEFIDQVTSLSPKPDITVSLNPIKNSSNWKKYLPEDDTLELSSYFRPDGGAWYYIRAKDGSDIFALPDSEPERYIQVLKIDQDYKNAVLSYDINTQPTPLDPTLLFGYPLDRMLIANRLMRGEGFMLHACGIGTPQGAIIFTGPSGAGKTTLCQYSQQFPDCTQFCDERIVVRRDATSPTGYRAYGTPWPGEGNIYNRLDGPLAAIFLIQHSATNNLRRAEGAQALSWLMREIFPTTWNREGISFTLNFAAELLEDLPCFNYGFAPTPEAITFARQAIEK